MRGTPVAFGIKGIFPLIKKHAPHCITPLVALDALPPSTRLAIDATLLIQRLHFADDAHPSRHLIGFHRLIRQMRESSLIPIMVFDNFSQGARLPAKMRENQKRREKRNLLTVRANMERLRGKRLEALAGAMKEWNEMRSEDRIKSAELLHTWNQEDQQRRILDIDDAPFRFEDFDEDLTIDLHKLHKLNETLMVAHSEIKDQSSISSEESSDFLIDDLPREEVLASLPTLPLSEDSSDLWSSVQEAESSKILYMASKIHRLRRQYGTLLSFDERSTQRDEMTLSSDVLPETPSQAKLTLAEGSVYRRLQAGTVDTGADMTSLVGTSRAEAASLDVQQSASEEEESKDEEKQEDELLALTAKNVLMQRSYSRSSAPLSSKIFKSCAELCELLKVPVLWTGDGSRTGGRRHEAEALASVLVRNKLADVVVSEDSDVLLYQVPLLRGVMGHKGLEYIDSVNVRRSLFPPLPPLDVSDQDKESQDRAEEESSRQMLDFALLCGTDFNRTVPRIGSITALKLIQEYKSIMGIRKESVRRRMARRVEDEKRKEKKAPKDELFSIPDGMKWREYSKELNEARRVFENPPSLYWEAHKLRQVKMAEPIDFAAVSEFLRSHNIAPREASPDSFKSGKLSHLSSSNTSSAFGSSPFSDGKGTAASWPA